MDYIIKKNKLEIKFIDKTKDTLLDNKKEYKKYNKKAKKEKKDNVAINDKHKIKLTLNCVSKIYKKINLTRKNQVSCR